jgi:hypothetical protein
MVSKVDTVNVSESRGGVDYVEGTSTGGPLWQG